MSDLAPGDLVRLKTDPSRGGVLKEGTRVVAHEIRVPVQALDGRLNWLPLKALEKVPADGESLSDKIADGAFVGPEWLRRTLARLRVAGDLADMVYSMEATGTQFYAHQFKPVLKLLNAPTDALLVADEVGLGKTIEAGLIWTELRARLDANRLLVLCPKTLCEKWHDELDKRFGVDARIVGALELLQMMSSERSASRGFAVIASMQSLRPPRGWDAAEGLPDEHAKSARTRLATLLRDAAEGDPLLDLLVIDEAHHMRNPETMLHKLGEQMNAVATHRVFLSATPIHLRNRDLNSLLKLIDPDTFEFEGTLDRIISANTPLIEARDLVVKPGSTAEEVIALIDSARGHDLLADSRALRLIREELLTGPLDRPRRASVAWRLENASQLSNFVTRTRRRDVEEFRIEREPKAPQLDMHEDERHFYEAITATVAEYARTCNANERFLLATPQRLLTSSLSAASDWWQGYARQPDADRETGPSEDEEGDIDSERPGLDHRPLASRLGDCAMRLDMTARLRDVDTKFQLLSEQLGDLWSRERDAKLIIFSSFKPTLRYLHQRLGEIGVATDLMHGSVSEPRDDILRRFREQPGPRILLSSEVGSEGVDLQFCWIVINYDLPWNPMRLEQRIGRVDRLGQAREKVSILNLVYSHTIDSQIYHRLFERLQLGSRALGEFEAVLGEPIRELTQRLLDPALSEQQKEAVIDQAAHAIEMKAKHTEDLEAQAGSLVRHGDFILSQIMESRDLNRWLSAEDILAYVKDRLNRSFQGCTIEQAPPGSDTWRIRLSPPARERFAAFLVRTHKDKATKVLEEDERQRYRFTSSVLQSRESRVENISQMHPLVRFAAHLDSEDKETVRAEVAAAAVLAADVKLGCPPGDYVVMVRQWSGTDGAGRKTTAARLAYSGADLANDALIEPDVAEALALAVTMSGSPIPNARMDTRREQAAGCLNGVVSSELNERYGAFVNTIKADAEDRALIKLRALDTHLRNKKAGLQKQADLFRDRASAARRAGNGGSARRNASLVAATEGRIRKLEEKCAVRRFEIDSQRALVPVELDVAALLVEVRDARRRGHGDGSAG